MRILVTNDDGWDAPGLELLRRVASEFGEVHSVAPRDKRSGCGHQLTLDRPLSFEANHSGGWVVDGMPADCVRLAVSRIGGFDWVFSGVNDGANLGVDSFISGTVAAAREARILGIPSIAISWYRHGMSGTLDWDLGASPLRDLIQRLLNEVLPVQRFWNVNLPDSAHFGSGHMPTQVFCQPDPSPLPMMYRHDGAISTFAGSYRKRERLEGYDIDTCFSGNISITML